MVNSIICLFGCRVMVSWLVLGNWSYLKIKFNKFINKRKVPTEINIVGQVPFRYCMLRHRETPKAFSTVANSFVWKWHELGGIFFLNEKRQKKTKGRVTPDKGEPLDKHLVHLLLLTTWKISIELIIY